MITKQQIEDAQKFWGKGVVKMGSLKETWAECEKYTNDFLDNLYAFDFGVVLFKPTKCEKEQFRATKNEALSYFIAGEDRKYSEDKGFAINPWVEVRFENHDMILEEKRAIAMGNYFFTDPNGNEVKVEFTFGYKLIGGVLKIDLHHSSLPYKH